MASSYILNLMTQRKRFLNSFSPSEVKITITNLKDERVLLKNFFLTVKKKCK